MFLMPLGSVETLCFVTSPKLAIVDLFCSHSGRFIEVPHYDINVHFSDLAWDWQRFSYVYWTLITCFVRLWWWLPGGGCCCCCYFLKFNDPLLIFKSLHTLYLSLLSVIWTVNIISHPIACIDISLNEQNFPNKCIEFVNLFPYWIYSCNSYIYIYIYTFICMYI